jgi:hypothetical protein
MRCPKVNSPLARTWTFDLDERRRVKTRSLKTEGCGTTLPVLLDDPAKSIGEKKV